MSVPKYVIGITAVIVAALGLGLFWRLSRSEPGTPVPPGAVAKGVLGPEVPGKKPPVDQTPVPAKPRAGEKKEPSARAVADVFRQWIDLATSPDFLGARTAQGYALTKEAYADFFTQLGLTPAEADRLSVLLTEKRLSATHVAIAQLRKGSEPDPESPEFFAAVATEKARIDNEIRLFLGEDRYRAFERYNHEREEQIVFTRLDRGIGNTPDALNAEQTAALRTLLQQSPGGGLTPEVIAASARFLTSSQVQALNTAFQRQVDILQQRYRDALPPRPEPH